MDYGLLTVVTGGGFFTRGAGMLNSTAVAASTNAATTISDVADRRSASAAGSVPNVGFRHLQFHVPSANTAATKHSFTINAMPYGVDQRFDNTCRCSHAMITPNTTSTADAVNASGENEYTMSETIAPR